ncbi:MAG: PspA/IM30 family protein [Proteobacteria bacterium]|nr:PspA/IM30 family protein [Pseudomonadota bacterium]
MSLFSRLGLIVSAKGNRALDNAENPSEMFDHAYAKMTAMRLQMSRSIADVLTARKLIETQIDGVRQADARLDQQSRQALLQGRDDLAQQALQQRAALRGQVQALDQQRQQMVDKQASLEGANERLAAKLTAFRIQKETLRATTSAADSQVKISESLAGLSEEMGDVNAAMERAQDKVARVNARAAALQDMTDNFNIGIAGPADSLQLELDRTGQASAVQSDLTRLKAELGLSPPAPIPLIGQPVPTAEPAAAPTQIPAPIPTSNKEPS